MKPIKPPDIHFLNAAVGWLELGNHIEADAELDAIAHELQVHPDVLEVRWHIHAKAGNWDVCVTIAQAITDLEPNRSSGWIDRAYALRRAKGGGLQAAWDALLPVSKKFPVEPLIPFNLSCYACQMGRLEDACHWLRQTFAVADKTGARKQFRLMALDEPDLQPLWQKIGALGK